MDKVKQSNTKTTMGCFLIVLLNSCWLLKLIFPKIDVYMV